jgi:hypothetical protein
MTNIAYAQSISDEEKSLISLAPGQLKRTLKSNPMRPETKKYFYKTGIRIKDDIRNVFLLRTNQVYY